MVLGPKQRLPDFDLHLGGASLPVVLSHKYWVLLTPTLSWTKHVQFLILRGNHLFAQCVAWCRAEHLPDLVASSIFRVHVLQNFSQSPAALHLLDGAIRRWSLNTWHGMTPLLWDVPFHGLGFWMPTLCHCPQVWHLNCQGRGPTMHLPMCAILTSAAKSCDLPDGATFSVNAGPDVFVCG